MPSDRLITELKNFIPFLQTLTAVPDEVLMTAMKGSQWSVCDVVSHIMKWDENFVQTTLRQIVTHKPAILDEHPDVQTFNQQAVQYGRRFAPKALLAQAIKCRSDLVSLLQDVPESDFAKVLTAQSAYTLAGFLEKMFVSHDEHHRTQMALFLAEHAGGVHT